MDASKRLTLHGTFNHFDEKEVPSDCVCLSLKDVIIASGFDPLSEFCRFVALSVLKLGCSFEDATREEAFYQKLGFGLKKCQALKICDVRGCKQGAVMFVCTLCQNIKSLERVIVEISYLDDELLKKIPKHVEIGFDDGKSVIWKKGQKLDFATVAAIVQKGGEVEGVRKDIDDSPDKTQQITPSSKVKPLKPWEIKKESQAPKLDSNI